MVSDRELVFVEARFLKTLAELAKFVKVDLPEKQVSSPKAKKNSDHSPTLAEAFGILQAWPAELAKSKGGEDFQELLRSAVGRKGCLPIIMRSVVTVDASQRQSFGRLANELKAYIHKCLAEQEKRALGDDGEQAGRTRADFFDLSLPGRRPRLGHAHPLSLITDRILDFFNRAGFVTVTGPEVETAYYNFTALNIPEGHLARAEEASFYFDAQTLLRTQTSNMQIRVAEKMQEPPIAIVAPGRVYRRDTLDATHSYTFHQVEGMYIDKGVSFADLKGILIAFCHHMFGEDLRVRFRPDYFPFTEPSCEIAIAAATEKNDGRGREGNEPKWLEILGAGLMHPAVLENVGVDADEYSGFAFGIGVERLAMLCYGIEDIRVFHENEHSFLRQFS